MRGRRLSAFAFLWILLLSSTAASAQEIPRPPFSKSAARPSAPESDPPDIKELKRILARDPTSASAWTTLGWRYYGEERYAEADWLLAEARKLAPADLYVLWLSGLTAYRMGQYPQAKSFLWTLFTDTRVWPDSIDKGVAYDVLGRLFLEEDKLFEAAFFFGKAKQESPGTWQYHFLDGFTAWYRQRYGDAYESLQTAIRLNAKDPTLLRYYAWAKAAHDERWGEGKGRERMKGALDAARKSIRASPGDAEGHVLLGMILSGVGERDEAIQSLRKAIALDRSSATARYTLARLLLEQPSAGRAEEAERLLVEAIAISPHYWRGTEPAPHVKMLAAALIHSGRHGAARALLEWHRQQEAQK